LQVSNLVLAALLNRPRHRRRLRRGLEDWANLYQHALNAELEPAGQEYLAAAGWRWLRPVAANGAAGEEPEDEYMGHEVKVLLLRFCWGFYACSWRGARGRA
jgi:hypothetical protein